MARKKDETEEGITGLPIPKKRMSPKNRYQFEKERKKERKKRGDGRVGDTFSQHRMTGSRGRGSEYEVNPRVSYRHNEEYLIGYLIDEGFASDEKSAQAIAGAMSEDWKQSIVESNQEEIENIKRLQNYEKRYHQKYGGKPDPFRRELQDIRLRKLLKPA